MTRSQFFKHFDLLADQPDAVAKMRELVLQLAIRGQLVEQITTEQKDDGWQKFLKAINGSTGNGDSPPFDVPQHWRWARLDDVADYSAARKVEPSEISEKDWVLDLEEIEKDTGRLLRFTSFKEKQSSSNKAEFVPGDVLYGKLRPYLNKVLVAPKAGFCTTEIVPIRSRGMIVPTYLCLFLRSPHFVAYTNAKSYGMKMPRLGTEDAIRAWIAVPPPGEQRRIVAKVDELMALCDELEQRQQARQHARAHLTQSAYHHLTTAKDPAEFRHRFDFILQHSAFILDDVPQLRQAILQLAVQGRLVPQNPKDEPAEKLLKRLRAKYPAEGVTEVGANKGKPFDLPAGWVWARFPELGKFSRGKSRHRPRNEPSLYTDGNYPLVQTGDVARANGIIRTHTGLYNEKGLAQSKLWPAGTMCITIAANIAETGILGMEACIPDSVVGFIPDAEFGGAEYFEFFMRTAKARLQDFAPSTAQKNINMGILESVYIPLPPLAEQKRIVARVEELLRWCDTLEAQLRHTRTLGAHLLDAFLERMKEEG